MLDSQTKTRIDSARDILVGKVPDPKSQVEQITIALIYKFMDDMDRQSEELGGKATFFTGEFKKYRWAQLLDKRYGGHERLLLYAEGIEKMNENKNIPQLFRDIFKGVFLPYRDPETLNLFLKEINGFSYDHSERLGDAFEYLLSVLGTQGDAGQFRTPRHIIDFIVAVVDPQKDETILDPACGTAGFLISAYKHIMAESSMNMDGQDGQDKGKSCKSCPSMLTPDERARLMTNFRGYDIAPDMVRLARANMYLHGFPNPTIHEYDALTSEERWDERCDVILANPPFMTPKGGVRPHNRFSIKAKRSEVLFVDYMAEHLNPGGRAGIIVPEGIIFQGGNAYKQLRRMLVENYLWAVVSLPAGVFNPYSGVKTSILFLDSNMARRASDVLFVKIENDGFDLGAQRRAKDGSQIEEATHILCDFCTSCGKGDWPQKAQKAQKGLWLAVGRKRLLESPDVNLSGDRYRVVAARHTGKWPMVKLEDVATVSAGNGAPQEDEHFAGGTIPFFRTSDVGKVHFATDLKESRDKLTEKAVIDRKLTVWKEGTILFPKSGASTFLNHRVMLGCSGVVSSHLATIVADPTQIGTRFLFYLLCRIDARSLTEDQSYPSLRLGDLGRIEIPRPPLDEQDRIVAELEGYRKVIEGARQILATYKPSIRIDPAWPLTDLGEVARVDGKLIDPKMLEYRNLPHVSAENIEEGTGQLLPIQSAAEDRVTSGKYLFDSGCVLYSKLRPYLRKAALANFRGLCSADMYPIRTDNIRLQTDFLFWILLSPEFTTYADVLSHRARMPKLNRDQLLTYPIPLPPLAVQQQIVDELKAERKLVDANRELITRMEVKIKDKLAEVWGETGN
jgi:type I restriction enzyme M protein